MWNLNVEPTSDYNRKKQTQNKPSGERKGKNNYITYHRYIFQFIDTYIYPGLFPMCLFPFKISFSTREGCEEVLISFHFSKTLYIIHIIN